ncbi:MAG: hypothetical protein ACRD2T_04085, partial [Thermoanaerobaculia bacterium]
MSDLRGFFLGRLEPEAGKRVLAHLFRGCSDCLVAIAPLASAMFFPERSEPEGVGLGDEYDFPIARAFASFRREMKRRAAGDSAFAESEFVAPAEDGEIAWARCEALLEASWNLRHEDPEGMVVLAAMAVTHAESIDRRMRGPAALADLQARAFAELGNARRVANDPLTAEADFLRARQRADLGTGDPLLLARLMDLTASLRVAQRRFEEASQLLTWAFELYRDAGENHLAGKVLVTRALALGYEGDSPEAVGLLTAALPLLDAARDP